MTRNISVIPMTETLRPTVGNVAAMLGGVGMVVGSIAPWASVSVFAFSRDIAGTATDGKLTLAIGVALVLAGLISMTVDWAGWLIVGLGLAGGAVALYDLVNTERLGGGVVTVGWGLILCATSAAVAVVGGISEAADL